MSASSPSLISRLCRAVRDSIPRGHAWWFVLAGCCAGLLLFLLVWTKTSDSTEKAEDGAVPAVADARPAPPLPAPLPAAADAGQGASAGNTHNAGTPVRIDAHVPQMESPAPAPLPDPLPETARRAAADTTPTDIAASAANLPDTVPRPISATQPDYPRASMRRGERGVVVLLVKVDASGRVTDVEVASSSKFRRLDRAAMAAVRRWRFEPAMRDGQPIAGELRIPFNFAPENN